MEAPRTVDRGPLRRVQGILDRASDRLWGLAHWATKHDYAIASEIAGVREMIRAAMTELDRERRRRRTTITEEE